MPKMKKVLIILATALVVFACNGQTPKNKHTDTSITPKAITEKEAIESFKKQKHRFEIKGYKIYYNDQLMKLDSVTHFIKRIGEPYYNKRGDIVWNTAPVWGMRYSTMEKFFIYFRPFFEGNRYYTDDFDDPKTLALKQMPVIDGYMLVEGIPIDKDITPQELKEALQPIYKENYGVLMGTPTLVFKLKEKQIKEIIPHWGADKAYNNIFIGFDYLKDEKTKKIIGLKSVDYSNFMM